MDVINCFILIEMWKRLDLKRFIILYGRGVFFG